MIHIIDDNPYVLAMLADVLDALGYTVESFSCPIEYCDYANKNDYNKPNIVITDVIMPNMNGFELMNHIAKSYQDIQFIVISGYDEVNNRSSNVPHQYIQKPFYPKHLHETIQTMLNKPT